MYSRSLAGRAGPPAARAASCRSLDQGRDGPALDELHGVEMDAALAADREDRHDAGVMQLRGGLGLDLEPPELVRVERRGERQHLQGHAAVERELDRFVNDPHAAAADDAQHAVIAQLERPGLRRAEGIVRREGRPPAA